MSCHKIAFGSKAEAKRWVRNANGPRIGKHPYLCELCGKWHTSSIARREARRRGYRYR